EGIRPAIESALLAAQTLAEVPDFSAASLALYERKMAARFGQRQQGKVADSDWLGLKKAIARPLMRTRWFTREVVTKRWFLHQQLPALAPGRFVNVLSGPLLRLATCLPSPVVPVPQYCASAR